MTCVRCGLRLRGSELLRGVCSRHNRRSKWLIRYRQEEALRRARLADELLREVQAEVRRDEEVRRVERVAKQVAANEALRARLVPPAFGREVSLPFAAIRHERTRNAGAGWLFGGGS